MPRLKDERHLARRLAVIAALATAPAVALWAAEPQTRPATSPAGTVPTELKAGQEVSFDQVVAVIARRLHMGVVAPGGIQAKIVLTHDFSPDQVQAIDLLNQMLASSNLKAYLMKPKMPGGMLMIRVGSPTEAKAEALDQGPMTSGTNPQVIDVSDRTRQVTHMFPITHPDLLEAVQKSAASDKEVTVIAANGESQPELIMIGPALNVRRAVERAVVIDPALPPSVSQAITLVNVDAEYAAGQINQTYIGRPPDQMVRALFDKRTNSVILSGQDMGVLEATMMLRRLDATPKRMQLPDHVEIPERRFTPPEEDKPPATGPGRRSVPAPETQPAFVTTLMSPLDVKRGLDHNGGFFQCENLPEGLGPMSSHATGDGGLGMICRASPGQKGKFFASWE